MSAIDTLRAALFGSPPQANFEPSREGVLAAFAEMDGDISDIRDQVSGIAAGVESYQTVNDLPTSPVPDNGTTARVYDDPDPENNTFWIVRDGAWEIDEDFVNILTAAVQPLVDEAQEAADEAQEAANRAKNGVLYSLPPGVAVDTTERTITFTNARLVSGSQTYLFNRTVSYEGLLPASYYIYRAPNGDVLLTNAAGVSSLEPGAIIFARLQSPEGRLIGLPGGYTRDGVEISPDAGDPRATRVGQALVIDPSDLDFDWVDLKITVSANITVPYLNYRILITPQEVDFSHIPFSQLGWGLILLDPATGLLSVVPSSALRDENLLVIGGLRRNGQRISGFDTYSVNGVPHDGGGGGDTAGRFDNLMSGWDYSGVFDAGVLPGYRYTDPIPFSAVTYQMIYSWYDDLVTDHPDYISRTHLGDESEGLPVYEYRFTPKAGVSSLVRPIRVMLLSGVHGYENLAQIALRHFMKLIADEWEDDPVLEAIRHSVEFSVIPAVAPWSINERTRVNSNGVNINRNYPGDWTLTEVGDNYSGPAALSEPETQYVYDQMVAFDPVIFLDFHNWGGTEEGRFIWAPTVSDFNRSALVATMNRMAVKWRGENSWMPDASNIGYTTSTSGGTGGLTAHLHGILGSTIEVADRLHLEPGGPVIGSPLTVKYGVETLGNALLIMLRKIAS